jgi:uncharacterized membrane protein YtjA (UPF0391 family)
VFFVISLLAGVFGFTGLAGAAAGIAHFFFYLFLALCVFALIVELAIGRAFF